MRKWIIWSNACGLMGFCLWIALLICGSVSLSYAMKLPDSDQRKCFQAVSPYDEVTCPAPGDPLAQDGSYIINPLSYTDNGTITDNNTGLMWQKQDDGNTYNWYKAAGVYHATYNPTSQDVCGELTTGGFSDWRLPTKKELVSIIDYEIPEPGPMINLTFFPNTDNNYWSSTPYAGNPDSAWSASFSYGDVSGEGAKSYALSVRCVRGGQLVVGNFVDNYDGTVTDVNTTLMWQQGEPGGRTWEWSLSYCEGLSLGGHTDWRLPNIKELESITDDATYGPAIDTTYFPNATAEHYWSSTTNTGSSDSAWYVWFDDGDIVSHSKSDAAYVRCVRGGQTPLITLPSNLRAKAISSGKIVLGWKDNSNNETGFKFERKKGGCGSTNTWVVLPASISANVVTYINSGLVANTVYSYRILAYNASGDSGYSGCVSAKTGLAGTPSSPTKLRAVSNSTGKVTLTWADNASNETGFKIYRKEAAAAFALLTTINSQDVKTYADKDAAGNDSTTPYSYYIQACNALGCSPTTNTAVVPFRPTVPKATPSTGKINFTWTDKSTNEKGFQVYRKQGTCSSTNAWSMIKTTVANAHAYSDTAVTSGSAYSYKVRAFTQSAALPYAMGYSMYTGCVSAVAP